MTTTFLNDDERRDWRQGALCASTDADLHYADSEELIDQGYTEDEAAMFQAEAEKMAKTICLSCPILTACLNNAMTNDEELGIWGGMNRAERLAHYPTWRRIQQELGAPVRVRPVTALHHNAGANGRYRRRAEQADACLSRLRTLPADWSITLEKYGTHTRSVFIEIFELALTHPDRTMKDLAATLDRSKTWFGDLFHAASRELGVD